MRAASGLGALFLLGACAPSPPAEDPCALDALRCRAPSGFELDPECSGREELAVELGEGAAEFRAFDAGRLPEVHYGSQGGRHIFVALRLPAPDLAHGTFQAFIRLQSRSGDAGTEAVAERDLVFGADDTEPAVGGGIDLTSIVFVLPEGDLEGPARLVVDIRDTCDRRGQSAHDFSWP